MWQLMMRQRWVYVHCFRQVCQFKDDNAEMAKVVHRNVRCGRQNNNSLKMSTPEFADLCVIVCIKRDLAYIIKDFEVGRLY